MGLRALYFLIAGVIHKFHYLKLGLSAVLVFVGIKMLVTYFDVHVPIGLALAVIGGVLAVSILASLMFPKAVAAHDPVVHDPLGRRPPEPVNASLHSGDDNDRPTT